MLQDLQTAVSGFQWVSILALVIAVIVAVVLIILWRKGKLSAEGITNLGNLLEEATYEETSDGSFLSLLTYYAYKAVRAVEQLVKSGQLTKDNTVRKETAISLVETYAAVDNIELTDADKAAIPTLIEAEVSELPHAATE